MIKHTHFTYHISALRNNGKLVMNRYRYFSWERERKINKKGVLDDHWMLIKMKSLELCLVWISILLHIH